MPFFKSNLNYMATAVWFLPSCLGCGTTSFTFSFSFSSSFYLFFASYLSSSPFSDLWDALSSSWFWLSFAWSSSPLSSLSSVSFSFLSILSSLSSLSAFSSFSSFYASSCFSTLSKFLNESSEWKESADRTRSTLADSSPVCPFLVDCSFMTYCFCIFVYFLYFSNATRSMKS